MNRAMFLAKMHPFELHKSITALLQLICNCIWSLIQALLCHVWVGAVRMAFATKMRDAIALLRLSGTRTAKTALPLQKSQNGAELPNRGFRNL